MSANHPFYQGINCNFHLHSFSSVTIRKAHSRPFSRDKRWRKAHSVLAREETLDRDLERRVVNRFAFAQKTSGANA